MSQAVIVLGHGSRNLQVAESFELMARQISRRVKGKEVRPAFFSLGRPTLEAVVADLADEGYKEIVVFPYFLYAGVHIRKDLPEMLADLKKEHPELDFKLLDTLENDPGLIDIVSERIQSA